MQCLNTATVQSAFSDSFGNTVESLEVCESRHNAKNSDKSLVRYDTFMSSGSLAIEIVKTKVQTFNRACATNQRLIGNKSLQVT